MTKEPGEVERRYISETLSDELKIEGAINIYIRLFIMDSIVSRDGLAKWNRVSTQLTARSEAKVVKLM